jgi:hypothetical protein
MNSHQDLLLWHTLYSLEARYWREVDFNGGRNAHEFYQPDGLMVVGHNRFEGREKIREFYAWRERQTVNAVSSVKTMRHLINNVLVEATAERRATMTGVISFYGAAARAPVPQSRPPMLVADLIDECICDDRGEWHFQSHTLRPVFMSDEAPLSIAVDTRR